jgi:alkylation response protein AidB-like acyl-CoA dehydrogenase
MNNLINLQGNLPNSTQRLLQQIKLWGSTELEPSVPQYWEKGDFPTHALESFRQQLSFLCGYTIPSTYRNNNDDDNNKTMIEYDLLTTCLISMTIASIDASFVTTLLVQYGLCCESIVLCGTPEQKHRLLPSLSSLHTMGCFCLTEPQSGSNASDLQTVAVKLDDDSGGGYHITGSKRWIGNGVHADVHIVWAKNMSLPGHPVMGFIVERKHQITSSSDPQTIVTTKIEGKISLRCVQNANIEFKNAYCPPENVMVDHGTYTHTHTHTQTDFGILKMNVMTNI